MGGTQGSLKAAITRADAQVTVLDDRIDAEEHAEWLWLKAHVLTGYPGHRVVLGTESLPLPWSAETKKFVDVKAGEAYLRHFLHNQKSMHALQVIAQQVGIGIKPAAPRDTVVTVVSAALTLGRAWVLELPKAGPKAGSSRKRMPVHLHLSTQATGPT